MASSKKPVIEAFVQTAIVVSYPVTEDRVRVQFARFPEISFDTPEGYEEGRLAIAECRKARGATEERRAYLKADSLSYGRRVDSRAKEIIAAIEAFELPLKAKKEAIDNAKEIARRAKEEAEKAAIRAAEAARMAAEREVLEAQRRALAVAEALARARPGSQIQG